jgi:hypothetical protein
MSEGFSTFDMFDVFFGDGQNPSRRVPSKSQNPSRRVPSKSQPRPRGYIEWKPRNKAVIQRVEWVQQVLVTYGAHLPLTTRQIFYALVGQHGYDKTELAYKSLCDTLVKARRAKIIAFDDIRDDGVSVRSSRSYGSVEDFHDETGRRARNYRRDRQHGQPQRIELWCEASGMMPQLSQVASEFSIPVYSCGGFSSLSGVRGIVKRVVDRNEETVFLHVGDYDPSGESIFDAMTRDVAAFVEADRVLATSEFTPIRVALTPAQIATYGLPTSPAKVSSHSKNWTGTATCQLEALPPNVLASIVENAIRDWIDQDTLEEVIEDERKERAELLGLPPGRDDER